MNSLKISFKNVTKSKSESKFDDFIKKLRIFSLQEGIFFRILFEVSFTFRQFFTKTKTTLATNEYN